MTKKSPMWLARNGFFQDFRPKAAENPEISYLPQNKFVKDSDYSHKGRGLSFLKKKIQTIFFEKMSNNFQKLFLRNHKKNKLMPVFIIMVHDLFKKVLEIIVNANS